MDSEIEITIDDTNIAAGQPRARAIVHARYELIWQACLPHVDGSYDGRPDPRMVQAAVTVTDRLSKLWRLDQPAVDGKDTQGAVETDRAVVARQLAELEARISPAA